MTLKELQKMINADLVFGIGISDNYYCRFSYVEFKENKSSGVLTALAGRGDTVISALHNYCEQISGKLLVYKAMSEDRLELQLGRVVP